MFGNNPVRKQELRPMGTLQVAEVFHTIQGEGPFVGQSAVFVRLSGCNLRCWFCDTKWDDDKDKYIPPALLVSAILKEAPLSCSLIVLTGGEPLRQNILPFLERLSLARGYFQRFTVQIETAGTLWIEGLDRFPNVKVVVSPKTPTIHPEIARVAMAYKYVIKAGEYDDEGFPMSSTQLQNGKRVSLARPTNWPHGWQEIFVSPMDEYDDAKNMANKRAVAGLAMRHGFRAGVQLHKVLNVP